MDASLLPGYRDMVSVLKRKGYRKGIDLEYFFDPKGDHTEKDWSRRLWRKAGAGPRSSPGSPPA